MPTTLLIVKNQGQPSNWSHYRNGSANALHFSAFRISIEAGEFQIEKINAGKLEKVLWSNVTVRDDSSGTMGTPVTPTSPIDLANILEGLGYPAYESTFAGAYIPLSGTIPSAPVTGNIEFESGYGFNALVKTNESEDFKGYFGFDGYGLVVIINDAADANELSNIKLTKDGLSLSCNSPTSRGFTGEQDFTPNITDLDFIQRKYVDNLTVNDSIGTDYDAAGLNAEYPSAPLGLTVLCKNINKGYKKSADGWFEFAATLLT